MLHSVRFSFNKNKLTVAVPLQNRNFHSSLDSPSFDCPSEDFLRDAGRLNGNAGMTTFFKRDLQLLLHPV
jgi:hypothetical protein